jgi:uncharacterized membrane protein YphA (DoxX/SURF4 family)
MTETTATDTTGTGTTTKAGGTRRAGNIVLWVLQVLGAVMFAYAGYTKLVGDAQMAASMGLGMAGMHIVGVLEIAGAVGLLLPGVAGFAGGCLVALMVGATIDTIVMLGLSPLVAFPVVTLILVAVIAWGRRRTVPRFVNTLLGR